MNVEICGTSIAGLSCALLLTESGCAVSMRATPCPAARVVVVAEPTRALLADIWQTDLPDLACCRALEERKVAWSSVAEQHVPVTSWALDVAALHRCLREKMSRRVGWLSDDARSDTRTYEWRVVAHGRPRRTARVCAGARIAVEGYITAEPGAFDHASAIASVASGWVFAAPHPCRGTALTLVSPTPSADAASLCEAARAAWPEAMRELEVGHLQRVSRSLCAPVMEQACASQSELCIGNAALQIDPLRGDGIGYGLRTALLANAVISQSAGTDDLLRQDHIAHYRDRIRASFRQHLCQCIDQYQQARDPALWSRELDRMGDVVSQLQPLSPSKFQLLGRHLASIVS